MWIDDATTDFVPSGAGTGLIDRDFALYPVGYLVCARAFDLPLMTDDEIEAAIRREQADGCLLEKLAHDMPILDQGNWGYCWSHSSVMAVQLIRALDNQPYEPLSAFAVASIINNYRNEGGWCTLSLEWIAKHGVPSQKLWPQGEVRRALDTREMREDAATRKVTEWMDLDPTAMKRQVATCLLSGIPVATDFNWWGHSVCSVRCLSWNPFSVSVKNSWSNWGDNGIGKLEGRRAIPDGAIAPRATMA